MPAVINDPQGTGKTQIPNDVKYEYQYPDDLNFDPRSDLHKAIVGRILQRAKASMGHMSRRHDIWKQIDRSLTSYVPLSEEEKRSQSKDDRKPVSIVFPYSHAILESLLSYMMAAYIGDPIFSYKGTGPNDVMGAILMTKAIDLHCNRTKVPLALHTMFRDAFSYGLGIVVPTWKEKWGTVYRTEKRGAMGRFFNFRPSSTVRVEREEMLFEGNELINIDPYKALLDPNTPIQKLQESEFFGWVENTNVMTLLGEEEHDDDMFNVKYLRGMQQARTSIYNTDPSDREARYGGASQENSNVVSPADVIHMYVNLIPKEWKLGDSEYPEKWYFQVAGDNVLIKARPMGLGHGMYPVAACAPDYDGYSSTPISRLEMLFGLQGTLDWLFNVHIANVRKAINDMFVYDPYLINSKDLQNPKDGWLIRTRRPAWGKGIKDAIAQLQVNDITSRNIGDSSWIVQWMQKIGASDDAMMGSLRQGGPERLTGAEFQGTQRGGIARLERMAKVIGWQAMQDIGYFFASHTQQLMSKDTYVTILGAWQETLMKEYQNEIKRGRMKVSPMDLLVDYDVLIRDGSIPGSNYSSVWEKMFTTIAEIPELQQSFDLVRIFKHIARNNGATNVEEFVRVKVMPDEQVMQQADRGNLVPFSRGANNG